ncbi:hypothetical protein AB0C38_10185 [Amycolatopsis sp. NPDC048633]|uniref:hypothetical protein n=1 Tax=Amycolatopsis sp. NPDC048633 TaxID=3157095 RepID=UPI003404032C
MVTSNARSPVEDGGWFAVASWYTGIEPVRADLLATLQDFATWMTALTGEQRAEFDAIEHG